MDKLKILVVDDESRMRNWCAISWKEKDMRYSKPEAVWKHGHFYEEKDIALIILDVMMPHMDGWQTCREIRKESKVPIIMLTARSEDEGRASGV